MNNQSEEMPSDRAGTGSGRRGARELARSSAIGIGLFVAALVVGFQIPTFWLFVATVGFTWVVIGAGANVIQGTAGAPALHSAGTMAISAYTLALLLDAGFPYALALLGAVVIATILASAVIAPALRLEGFYLAIASFVAVLLIQAVISQWESLTRGPLGMAVRGPAVGSFDPAIILYLSTAGAALVAMYAFMQVSRSKVGVMLRAARDSKAAASSIGVSPLRARMLAIVIGNGFVAVGGALFASASRYIGPDQFGLTTVLATILVVWVGGLDQPLAPLPGAFLVSVVPNLSTGLQEYSALVVYGSLLVLLLVRPNGLITLLPSRSNQAVLR